VAYLLDTHILLWIADGSVARYPVLDEVLKTSKTSDLIVSALSFWELAIKSTSSNFSIDLYRLRSQLAGAGYPVLPFTADHALAVQDLPLIHSDPFDRGLIAQALCEGVTLITRDAQLPRYPAPTLRVT
jgi:PIN domain nuclease of toxin-antitoxin system